MQDFCFSLWINSLLVQDKSFPQSIALSTNPLIAPLAIVLIGGLISSTLLSRIVTPVVYKLMPPAVTLNQASSQQIVYSIAERLAKIALLDRIFDIPKLKSEIMANNQENLARMVWK